MCLTEIEARHKLREFSVKTSKIKLSKHARERMSERCISLKQIICCFEHGDITEGPYPDARGDCMLNITVRTAGEYIAVVVVIKAKRMGIFLL